MGKIPRTFWAGVLVWSAIAAGMMAIALPSWGQPDAPSPKSPPPPADWIVKWQGMYGGRTNPGPGIAPPGYSGMGGQAISPQEEAMVAAHSQPWILARRDVSDWEVEDYAQMCKPNGLFRGYMNGGFELLATPDRITMLGENGGNIYTSGLRRIYMNRPHLKNPPLNFYGDSVGHWEGETLVIDSIGFNDNTWFGADRYRHSEAMHVVERLRFVDNGKYLEHLYIVDDPLALTGPITFLRFHKRLPASTPFAVNICEDSPDGPVARRAFVKLHNRAVQDWEDKRAAQNAAINPSDKK